MSGIEVEDASVKSLPDEECARIDRLTQQIADHLGDITVDEYGPDGEVNPIVVINALMQAITKVAHAFGGPEAMARLPNYLRLCAIEMEKQLSEQGVGPG